MKKICSFVFILMILISGAGLFAGGKSEGSASEEFTGTVTIIVPAAAGGTSDILARLIAPHLQTALGVNVVVENKPGANGNIGADFVAHAPKDAQTLYLYDLLGFLANPEMFGESLTYSVQNDLTGIGLIMFAQYIMAVNPELPVNNTEELIAYSKNNPGSLVFASAGMGNNPHLTGVQFAKTWGVDWKFVHFSGGADAIRAVASNEANIIINGATATQPFVVQNQMKGISVSGKDRLPSLPDLPTWLELKNPAVDNGSWQGLLTTAGSPKAKIERLNAELNKILANPEIVGRIVSLGGEPRPFKVSEYNDWLESNLKVMTQVVKDAGVKLK